MHPRLRRLVATLVPSLLLGSCAVVGPQPAAPSSPGMVRMARPHLHGQVTLAGGRDEHDIDGAGQDDTDAGLLGVLIEAHGDNGIGGGISIETMGTDDDLFQSTGALEASWVEVAPFFLYEIVSGDRFRMPLRAGPWIHVLEVNDANNSDFIRWGSVGVRLAVEPEVVISRNEDFAFSLFSSVSVAGGSTGIDAEVGNIDHKFDTDGGAFGLELGPRIRWSHFMASVSFIHRTVSMDDSDTETVNGTPGVFIRGFDNDFDAIAFTFGGGF